MGIYLSEEKITEMQSEVFSHFQKFSKDGVGTMRKDKIKDKIREMTPNFSAFLALARTGQLETPDGVPIAGRDITLDKGCKAFLGCSKAEFLESLGIFGDTHTLANAVKILGGNMQLSHEGVKKMTEEYSKFDWVTKGQFNDSIHSTNTFKPLHFIIPELILDMVKAKYVHTARYTNWISQNNFVSATGEIKVPITKKGDIEAAEILEGGSIPLGTIEFAQKLVKISKYGIGVKLTRELLEQSQINILASALEDVGSTMNIGEDVKALQTLINGEQASGDESAATVGIDDPADGYKQIDVDDVVEQMKFLNMEPNLIIALKADLLANLNETTQEWGRKTLRDYFLEIPNTQNRTDTWAGLPANNIMYVDTRSCLARLQYGAMVADTENVPRNQTNNLYFTMQSGFYIQKRDGRVLQDKTLDIDVQGYPAFMDYENFILNGAYKDF